MNCIAVAVSGGADSLYALVYLNEKAKEQGHSIIALHGLFLPSATKEQAPIAQLQNICQGLHIPLHVLDMRKIFDNLVITPFIRAYAAGLTPNPCALCNASIKFGLLMDAAHSLGADMLATGHYATLRSENNSTQAYSPLSKGADSTKDQSYFLALVPQERLARALFPLANTQKKDNRAFLHARGIAVPLPKESQEICFVPADAYRPFIEHHAKEKNIPLGTEGFMFLHEDEEGKQSKPLGKHGGLWQYTEGQRRGLGIGWKEPLYVCGKDFARNALILGTKQRAVLRACIAENINWFIAEEQLPQECFVRVRYRQQEAPATIYKEVFDDGEQVRLHIHFTQAQSLTAPGQIAVLYDSDGRVLAGGSIKEIWA